MKNWVKSFFSNTKNEVELKRTTFEKLAKTLKDDGWQHKDEYWTPDLQINLFVKGSLELNLLQETYFDLKISGSKEVVQNIIEKLNE